jgi:hypothetical protein
VTTSRELIETAYEAAMSDASGIDWPGYPEAYEPIVSAVVKHLARSLSGDIVSAIATFGAAACSLGRSTPVRAPDCGVAVEIRRRELQAAIAETCPRIVHRDNFHGLTTNHPRSALSTLSGPRSGPQEAV